jgi:hypothetical protein
MQKSPGDAEKDETTFFKCMPWNALVKTTVVVPKLCERLPDLKEDPVKDEVS